MTYPDGSVVKNLLPMQKTWVQSQIQEDTTCHSTTKPVCHNYWACGSRAWELQLLKPSLPTICAPRREATTVQQRLAPLFAEARESTCAAMKTQHSQKWINEWMNKNIKKILFKKQEINGNMVCWKLSQIWFFKSLHFHYMQKMDFYSGQLYNANLFIFACKLHCII